jgi:hypothetical protein
MKTIFSMMLFVSTLATYAQKKKDMNTSETKQITCKLTTSELQERKRTIIASLKSMVLERTEVENGLRFKFKGDDETHELLTSFVKTERLCCDFFTFSITVGGVESDLWLELSGPEGAKEFIKEEIGL